MSQERPHQRFSRPELLLALGIAAFAGCKKDPAVQTLREDTSKASQETLLPQQDLPEFTFTDKGDFGTRKPDGLQMEDGFFMEAVGRFISIFQKEGIPPLLEQLRLRPEERSGIMFSFAQQTPGVLGQMAPEIAAHLDAYFTSRERQLPLADAIQFLNGYMTPAGYAFFFSDDEDGVHFDLHPIQKTSYAVVHGREFGSHTVPIIHLQRGIIETQEAKPSEEPKGSKKGGFYPHGGDAVYVFDDVVSAAHQDLSEHVHVERGHFESDMMRHETLHAALAKSFPSVSALPPEKAYMSNIELSLDHGFARFPGAYTPVMFSELCGVGIQLAQSSAATPYYLAQYLSEGAGVGYSLLQRLLPIILLGHGPKNELRRGIVTELMPETPGGHHTAVDYKKLFEYIETCSPDQIRAIGKQMYQIGFDLLQRAEQGQFPVIDMPR